MSRSPLLALVAVSLALAPNPARAEEPRYGLQLHASQPQGDLKDAQDSKLGLGMGAHMTFDLRGGHMIRPRFDAVFFPSSNRYGFTYKTTDLSLGADYLYFLRGKPQGAYLIAGLGLHHWKTELSSPAIGGYPAGTVTDTSNKLGTAFGIGYSFNHAVGAELRYLCMVTKDGADKVESRRSTLELGINYRF